MDGWAPIAVTVNAPAALAKRRASSTGNPLANATANAPLNASSGRRRIDDLNRPSRRQLGAYAS